MSSPPENVHEHVREVTDEEIATLWSQGWVQLRRLVSPELAAALLERAKTKMGPDGLGHAPRPGLDDEYVLGNVENYHYPWQEDALFGALATSRTLARNAGRLVGRPCGIRLLIDALGANAPVHLTGRDAPTRFHQPGSAASFDRDTMGFSISLSDSTPEQGSLQYFTGSHALGLLGNEPLLVEELHERFPRTRTCPVSEVPHLDPGDATAHMSTILLGIPVNHAQATRWSYVIGYLADDTRYTGIPSRRTDGRGLEPGDRFEHPDFPLLHPGDEAR